MPETDIKTGGISSSKLAKPGDIVIEEITIRSYTGFTMNVKTQLLSLVIYEDIHNNCLTGQLILNDTIAMQKHFPLVGNEEVTIRFFLPGDSSGNRPVEIKFRTFNVSAQTKTATSNARCIVIEMTSKEIVKGSTNRFSKAYNRMTYSDMVQKIMSEQVFEKDDNNSVIEVEPTFGVKDVVIPYWNPFYAINWMAQKSMSKSDFYRCDYMLYQTMDGFYHFKSISSMKDLPVVAKYTHIPGGNRMQSGEMPTEQYLRNIHSFNVVASTNRMDSIANGVYASTVITFDTTTKRYQRNFYNYSKNFGKESAISEYPTISLNNEDVTSFVNSRIKMYPKHSYQFDGNRFPDNPEAYVLKRQAQLNRMDTQKLRLEVPGDSRIHVGDIIEVEIPAFEETKNKEEWRDTQLSGKYMIMAIKHMLIEDNYSMEMIVAKDSLDYQLPDSKNESLKAL